MTNNKHKFFNILLFLLPIIDLITSLTTRYLDTSLTIGIVIKGLMLLYFIWYISFITSSKFKKTAVIYLLIMLVFIILYFAFKKDLLSSNYLFAELAYMFKLLFFPIVTAGLLCFYSDSGFDKKKMNYILLSNVLIYAILILIPLLTNTAFNSYIDGSYGFVGWYYSANEISAILVLLFPFLYTLISDKYPSIFLFCLPVIVAISQIGTKVSFFGMVIVGIICAICAFLEKKKLTVNPASTAIIILLFIVLFMYNSFALNNMNRIINVDNNTICLDKPAENINTGNVFSDKISDISKSLLSGRDQFIIATNNIYNNTHKVSKYFFGLGFSNTERVNDNSITKLIEIDLVDIFYHFGLLGLFIILAPFIYLLIKLIFNIKNKKVKFNRNILFYGLMILLISGISCISGHVLLDPAVSIYISLYFIYMFNEIGEFRKSNLDSHKISILSLHLGCGGAERSTIDTANMLSDDYEVELVSLYKLSEKPAFNVNNNVKIVYLSNLTPNREEFKKALKTLNIFKIIKEGFYSIKVLYYKNKLICDYVEYSNAKTIISTREYFTVRLSKYGRKSTKKIAVEHNYNVDSKFIKNMKKYLGNIDVFVTVSQSALSVYNAIFPKEKIIFIPNTVSDIFKPKSNLNNKKIVCTGRLEEEKGFLDAIDIMKILINQNEKIGLDIIGDGSLHNAIEQKIKDNGLVNYVKLLGIKMPEEINEIYSKSSLYLMTSYKESFGIVLIEAMASGLPVIAFDTATGAKEIIVDNKNGFIVNNRDKELMVEKIINYFNMEDKTKLQKNAISTAENYSFDKIKKSWLEVLAGE